MDLNPSVIPHRYNNVYSDRVDGFLLIYNPTSDNGLTVLNKEAAYLYSLIDNKRNLKEILQLAKRVDKKVKFQNIIRIFNDLLASEIIYFGSPKKYIFAKTPK